MTIDDEGGLWPVMVDRGGKGLGMGYDVWARRDSNKHCRSTRLTLTEPRVLGKVQSASHCPQTSP